MCHALLQYFVFLYGEVCYPYPILVLSLSMSEAIQFIYKSIALLFSKRGKSVVAADHPTDWFLIDFY